MLPFALTPVFARHTVDTKGPWCLLRSAGPHLFRQEASVVQSLLEVGLLTCLRVEFEEHVAGDAALVGFDHVHSEREIALRRSFQGEVLMVPRAAGEAGPRAFVWRKHLVNEEIALLDAPWPAPNRRSSRCTSST